MHLVIANYKVLQQPNIVFLEFIEGKIRSYVYVSFNLGT